jgi:hypothetical protein
VSQQPVFSNNHQLTTINYPSGAAKIQEIRISSIREFTLIPEKRRISENISGCSFFPFAPLREIIHCHIIDYPENIGFSSFPAVNSLIRQSVNPLIH